MPADSFRLKSELRVAGFAGQRSPSAELSSARSAAKKAPHRERVSGSARLTMSFDAKTQAILSFLQAQAAAAPELAGEYAQMEDLYKRKLAPADVRTGGIHGAPRGRERLAWPRVGRIGDPGTHAGPQGACLVRLLLLSCATGREAVIDCDDCPVSRVNIID